MGALFPGGLRSSAVSRERGGVAARSQKRRSNGIGSRISFCASPAKCWLNGSPAKRRKHHRHQVVIVRVISIGFDIVIVRIGYRSTLSNEHFNNDADSRSQAGTRAISRHIDIIEGESIAGCVNSIRDSQVTFLGI